MQLRDIRKMCRRLAKWHWYEVNPYNHVVGAVGVEAALNLVWAVSGHPHHVREQDLINHLGKMRQLARETVEGRLVEDFVLTCTPDEFLKVVERHPKLFTNYCSMGVWKKGLTTRECKHE